MWRTRFVELNGALVAQPIRELGILNMSEDCRLKSCRLALPEGAQPAGFSFDAERQQWVLFVQHESFDEIPEGAGIPEMLAGDWKGNRYRESPLQGVWEWMNKPPAGEIRYRPSNPEQVKKNIEAWKAGKTEVTVASNANPNACVTTAAAWTSGGTWNQVSDACKQRLGITKPEPVFPYPGDAALLKECETRGFCVYRVRAIIDEDCRQFWLLDGKLLEFDNAGNRKASDENDAYYQQAMRFCRNKGYFENPPKPLNWSMPGWTASLTATVTAQVKPPAIENNGVVPGSVRYHGFEIPTSEVQIPMDLVFKEDVATVASEECTCESLLGLRNCPACKAKRGGRMDTL